ncbi:unnamed protein product [Aureobasidium pullulans]|nr:unnamed protein product [Aureobasidium pullulans]
MAPRKPSGSKPGRNKRKRLAAEKKQNADASMSAVVKPRYPLPPKPPPPAWQQATSSVVVPSIPTTQSKFSFSSSIGVKPTAIGNTKPTFDDADPVARSPGSARAISTPSGDVSASASASGLGTEPTFDDADPITRIPSSARAIPTSTGAVSASAYASAGLPMPLLEPLMPPLVLPMLLLELPMPPPVLPLPLTSDRRTTTTTTTTTPDPAPTGVPTPVLAIKTTTHLLKTNKKMTKKMRMSTQSSTTPALRTSENIHCHFLLPTTTCSVKTTPSRWRC